MYPKKFTLIYLILILSEIEIIYCSCTRSEKFQPTTDYCSAELCKKGRKHIACNNDGKFAPKCGKNAKMIEMTPELISYTLRIMNELRNNISLGLIEGYEPAKRMPELQWCPELAYLAELNVKRCIMEHDECRNTKNYPKVGQNIARRSHTVELPSPRENIEHSIKRWFEEYKDADQSFIDKYRPHPENKVIGHFTVIALDRAKCVGCSMVQFVEEQPKKAQMIFTCDFSATNILNAPIYNKGDACSECKTGCSDRYKALCTTNEEVSSVPPKRRIRRPKNKNQ